MSNKSFKREPWELALKEISEWTDKQVLALAALPLIIGVSVALLISSFLK